MQRKVFRIEQMAGAVNGGRRRATDMTTSLAINPDITRLQELVTSQKRELAALIHEGKAHRMALAAGELGAAVESMEKATQNILKAAESIDDDARALSATLKNEYERSLAHDIQEHVVQLYEACNFQDLAGQRIGKVVDMLGMVETQLAAMLARCNGGNMPAPSDAKADNGLINGPRLDGASGHVTQHDIDMLFG